MNQTYSPSRISLFDNCKLAYKYRYIDGLTSDIVSIERFRGGIVHEALKDFYRLVKGGRVEPCKWLLNKYKELWDKNYTEDIKIVKNHYTAEDYFKKGKECLIDYYNEYKPFDQTKIVDTEKRINFIVQNNEKQYRFRGILDRLDWNVEVKMFEIHDYKTSSRLITQKEADNDWQLGLYHVGLKKLWPEIEKIKLVWHFLLLNKEIVSIRTPKQISSLKDLVGKKIEEIESCDNFTAQKNNLCHWCDYQNMCPLWKHPKEMEELPINKYKQDPGVKLVAEYKKLEEKKNELKEEINEIEEEQKKIKEAAIEFAEKEKISIIDGSSARLKVDIKEEWQAPTRNEDLEKWGELRNFLIKEGRYEEVSTVFSSMINHRIRKGVWPQDFIEKITKFLKRQIKRTVKLIKK